MKNLSILIMLIFCGVTYSQDTYVKFIFKGEKDAEWMCGITSQYEHGLSHQAIDCYDGHLFIDSQTIEITVTEPGSYCVRMKSKKYDRVSMVYFSVNEGDNYELKKRIRRGIYNFNE